MLGPEKLQKLEFPPSAEPNVPLKRVVYKSDSVELLAADNATVLPQYAGVSRFNLFTGNQTLHERGKSFKVLSCT